MLKTNLEKVRKRIDYAAGKCGRQPGSVRLVVVTKTVSVERIKEAVDAGADTFGENYIQEARDKIQDLSAFPVSWHFIGHLQTNKAKYAVNLFDLIHSVDSIKLAREIDKQAGKAGKIQDILIQVNVAGEVQKSGIAPEKTFDMIKMIAGLENITLNGLMTMPPFFNDPEKVRPYFRKIRELRDRMQNELAAQSVTGPIRLDELSMGMTGDFEAAVEEGATLVRIGTAIFGERS
ncbi:MAG: YggS family pyridoxal phosphate-dependent enzyme [Desulfobacterales bacterium]